MEQDAKGRSVRVVIEAWHEMHFSEAPTLSIHSD